MSEIKLRLPDDDLVPLLRRCDAGELDNLVGYITGKGRFSSQLAMTRAFRTHHPDHPKYADEIAAEIQKYGGNTILNLVRGGYGASYTQITRDVAKRLGIENGDGAGIEEIERQILLKVLEKSWEKMENHEKRTLLKGIIRDRGEESLPGEFPSPLFLAVLATGSGFAAYKLSALIASAVSRATLKRGITGILGTALSRWATLFTGAVGWGITALWAISDLAGPAYRVTVPCVLHVAMLRQLHNLKASGVDPENIMD